MEHFEKLKEKLPEIAKIVAAFPESLQEKVFDTLVSELLGNKRGSDGIEPKIDKSNPLIQVQGCSDLSAVATLTPEGLYHLSIRDLKATNAKDAVKRLVYVIIRSYTKLMNSPSVSRKDIVNPELVKWRLADGNSRGYIASDRGIIKQGDQLCLDIHAQNEADEYIRDIEDSEKIGSWKPGTAKKQRHIKNGSENIEDQNLKPISTEIGEIKAIPGSLNEKPLAHSLEEVNTTSTIAQILNTKIEKDLILSAAMKFCLIDSKDTFKREEVLNEMKTATSYYKASFLNNATKDLKKLVRIGKLRENAPGIYALSADTKKELRYKLGLE